MDKRNEIDARGLRCPLPVLRLRKVLADLPAGAQVDMLADDPMVLIDLPHFCAEAGHRLDRMVETGDTVDIRVTKGTG